jgi:hypothetical protein
MVERLLLDGIDAEAGGAAVGCEHDLVSLARAHEAKATLTFVQFAITGTDIALNAPVFEPVPIASRPAL